MKKGYKQYKQPIYIEIYRATKESFFEQMEAEFQTAYDAGCADPLLTIDIDYGYDRYDETRIYAYIEGEIPLTKQEVEKQEAEAKKQKEYAANAKKLTKKKKDAADVKEYARLHKKFKGKAPA